MEEVKATATAEASASVGVKQQQAEPVKESGTMEASPFFAQFMAPAMATYANDAAHASSRKRDAVDIITTGMAQGFALDSRILSGALTGAILRGDNASEIAGLNAAVRAPTTIDHPNAVVGK